MFLLIYVVQYRGSLLKEQVTQFPVSRYEHLRDVKIADGKRLVTLTQFQRHIYPGTTLAHTNPRTTVDLFEPVCDKSTSQAFLLGIY